MKITVDKEAHDIIQGLLDLALKVGGIENLEIVNSVRNAIELDDKDD